MSDRIFLWIFGILAVAFIIVNIVGGILGSIQADKEYKQRCLDYCNCSVTQDCPYTFDYDEVKDCDCDARY